MKKIYKRRGIGKSAVRFFYWVTDNCGRYIHYYSQLEIYSVVKGWAAFIISGENRLLTAWQMAIVDKYENHSVETEDRTALIFYVWNRGWSTIFLHLCTPETTLLADGYRLYQRSVCLDTSIYGIAMSCGFSSMNIFYRCYICILWFGILHETKEYISNNINFIKNKTAVL